MEEVLLLEAVVEVIILSDKKNEKIEIKRRKKLCYKILDEDNTNKELRNNIENNA